MVHDCRHSDSVADVVSTASFVRSNLDLPLDQRCQDVPATTSICEPLLITSERQTLEEMQVNDCARSTIDPSTWPFGSIQPLCVVGYAQ